MVKYLFTFLRASTSTQVFVAAVVALRGDSVVFAFALSVFRYLTEEISSCALLDVIGDELNSSKVSTNRILEMFKTNTSVLAESREDIDVRVGGHELGLVDAEKHESALDAHLHFDTLLQQARQVCEQFHGVLEWQRE